MSTFLRDLGYAVRSFRRTPGFTAMALITLALGIGANVAIFTVLSAVVLRPLPYPEPNRIVQLSAGYPYTAMQVVAINEQAVELEALSAAAGASLTLTGDGTPEEIGGTVVGQL